MAAHALDGSLPRFVGLAAALDRRFVKLSESGLIPPYPSRAADIGALAGMAAALGPKDWAFWGPSLCTPALLRGLTPTDLIEEALFASRAADFAKRQIARCSHSPAARLPHAGGLGWAARRDGVAVLAELGDSAIADGDVHVGLNFAAVMKAPVVFVIRSDGAIPVAARGEGYGIPASVIDGSDAEAVQAAVVEALERARRGEGPTLLEARISGRPSVPEARVQEHDSDLETALAEAERNGAGRPRSVDLP